MKLNVSARIRSARIDDENNSSDLTGSSQQLAGLSTTAQLCHHGCSTEKQQKSSPWEGKKKSNPTLRKENSRHAQAKRKMYMYSL